MKLKIISILSAYLILVSFILSSCSNTLDQSINLTSLPTLNSSTLLPTTLTSTITQTVTPTSTHISTPTSNFQNIPQVIFTHALPEICPPNNSSEIDIPNELPLSESAIINILNNGGVEKLVRFLSQDNDVNFRYEDLTNDGIPELIVRNWDQGYGYLNVYGCQNSKYENLLTLDGFIDFVEFSLGIIAIQDLNHNGVKELVVDMIASHCCTGIMVYEWNGISFESVVKTWYVDHKNGRLEYRNMVNLGGIAQASIADIDSNGIYELILDGGRPSYTGGWTGIDGPWRNEKIIYMWNGENYAWYSQEHYPPNFRFEAIQDGDTETERGNYDLALKFYQSAIFDNKLKSWTQEVWRDISQNQDPENLAYPDIEKMPFNQDEYNQLSAYARYRIMILYLKQDWMSDAKTIYETLIEEYPQGNSGYPYVELATEFWNEFQTSNNLFSSCTKAIMYATNKPEILEPLGSHGLFDKNYDPEDICPFK
ncbi:MAG: hypothetical protein KF758_11410 [Anaerolineales bacterium]|nr:hypothetical protein [Anaerolineales bacterium]MBX3037506.1 hypothetical protein [Anaerolineales bacterium]